MLSAGTVCFGLIGFIFPGLMWCLVSEVGMEEGGGRVGGEGSGYGYLGSSPKEV